MFKKMEKPIHALMFTSPAWGLFTVPLLGSALFSLDAPRAAIVAALVLGLPLVHGVVFLIGYRKLTETK